MAGDFRLEPHPFLRCGERVRVIRGSLLGVEGILIRKKNQFRLVLSVDMLAKSVAVELDAADVEPVFDLASPIQRVNLLPGSVPGRAAMARPLAQ
jgi:hypothetical protein